jgi:hypothetical protein
MQIELVDIHLSVDINNEELIAHLLFSNNTSDKIYLDKLTICFSNKIRNDYFRITDTRSRIIDYHGVMINRDVEPGDFLELLPGEKVETNVKLNEVYKLKKGKKYTIQYFTNHPSLVNENGFEKLESNKVEIIY